MRSSIALTFEKCKKEKTPALLTYTVAGDNTQNNSLKILNKISKHADILELGFPHNTPIADGGQIQGSSYRALKNGLKLNDVFQIVKKFKRNSPDKPLILMGYYNLIYQSGENNFLRKCKTSGVDGCIIVDSNNEAPEDNKIFKELTKNDIAYIKLIAPTNDSEYIKQSLKKSSSWVYIVSYAGVTGSKQVNISNVKKLAKMIRKQSQIPIGVGFGIKTYNDVRKVSKLAELVVCGSSIVNKIKEGSEKGLRNINLAQFVGNYDKKLSQGVKH